MHTLHFFFFKVANKDFCLAGRGHVLSEQECFKLGR